MKEKRETYPLLDTSVCQFTYDDYCDYCEDMGIEPAADGSSEFWDWCYDEAKVNYDSDLESLACSAIRDRWFLITGTLGLWWGHPEIHPVLIKGILPAIRKCFGSCDDLDAELNIKEGVINVCSHHHDGTNCLTLLMLNKNGEKWAQALDDRGEKIEYNNHWWTKLKSIYDIWPAE